ncbi:hypothetical protein RISK_000296 [Rhodopirellula islandica]|uniref:Uncharacterized protein n=1 Tax=Rhodopirellula islandica TaxID=595434 RepID=A0A0J1BMG4_RHOIS|nr:hypothetical protein RISK_000296 [Rhodopirellula islandica]
MRVNSTPRPMTPETTRTVSNTRTQSASVPLPDGTAINVPPDDYELFRQLFRELGPVKSTHEAPGLPGLPQCERMPFAAGNLANVGVMVRDDGTLTYSLDDSHYNGGDAKRFIVAAESIRSRLGPP